MLPLMFWRFKPWPLYLYAPVAEETFIRTPFRLILPQFLKDRMINKTMFVLNLVTENCKN